ncbi:LysR family transcriptional regulator [Bacillus sp. Marseille-P3661]|uniref:LysR family transcriptional regulator n=1 Tax=Bacillus sp. Marseille-P3661 TaxID=1936234 RepID=UPI000C81E95B|nr:LysR family transcriptional regulator [Bacillus sp. Marseille-P3661]
MDIDSIKSFLLMSEIGNLTETAERLYLSPSSLTGRIKKIEKELGEELFILKGRTLSLSPAGLTFLHYAKQICELEEELEKQLQLLSVEEQRFRIGVSPSISTYMLPKLIKEFKTLYPNLQLNLISFPGGKVREALINNEIDLGIVQSGEKYETIEFKHWFSERDIMVVSANNPWAAKKEIYVEELKNQPLLAYQRYTFLWKNRLKWMLQHGVNPWIGLELSHIETVKEILLNDYGYSFLPIHGIENELKNEQLIEVKIHGAPSWTRETYFISNKNKPLPAIYHDFIDYAISKIASDHFQKEGKLIS